MKFQITPFVKWAGGKNQLLGRLTERMPEKFNRYYEPFIGGGALLLNVQPQKAVINDTNRQLINVYRQLKADAGAVIEAVKRLDAQPCDKDTYLTNRSLYNEKILNGENDPECAALMIWINKHCFNGLYRVNSKGLFNVPYNNKTTGSSIDENNLIRTGDYLREADIRIQLGDFAEACADARAGDFVYFDSPYVPVSETANFTDYTMDGFTMKDHVRLAELVKKLSDRGVKIMVSNHDVPLVRELYWGFRIEETEVRRAINRDASKRKGKEVIITNY